METAVLKVTGMTCGGCVRSVTNVLKAVPGVASAEVSLEQAQARITFDPARAALPQLRKAIEDAGYKTN